MTEPRIVLYTKPGCHLCDDMRDQLEAALRGTAHVVHHIDIAGDLDVYMRYRYDIPVLHIDGAEVARHRITDAALAAALGAAGLR
ncbi:MAG: glutaredoxin family protein [Vicinamibacterales bacterium]